MKQIKKLIIYARVINIVSIPVGKIAKKTV